MSSIEARITRLEDGLAAQTGRCKQVEAQVAQLVKKDEIAEAVADRLSDRRSSLFSGGERAIGVLVAVCSIGSMVSVMVTAVMH